MKRSRACWMSISAVALSVGILAAQPAGCSNSVLDPAQRALESSTTPTTGTDGPEASCALMQALDGDQDGGFSDAEVAAASDLLLTLDGGGDGILSAEDLCAGSAPCPDCPCLLLDALDADKDGELSADEIATAPDSLLALDTDADGAVSAEELCPEIVPPPPPPLVSGCPLMQALDTDQDGALSADEIAGAESLLALDVDGDGRLTCSELCQLPACSDDSQADADKPGKCSKPKKDKGHGKAWGHDKNKHGGNCGKAKGKDKNCGGDDENDEQGCRGCLSCCPLLRVLDTDGDCELSAEEIANAPASLATLDRDGDGTVTGNELWLAVADELCGGCNGSDGDDKENEPDC